MHRWKRKKSFHKGMSQWFSDEFKTHFKLLRNCLILRLTLGNLWCFQNSNVWQRNVAFFALISYKPPIAKWIADMGGKIKDKSPRGKKTPLLISYLIRTLESFPNSKLNDVLLCPTYFFIQMSPSLLFFCLVRI